MKPYIITILIMIFSLSACNFTKEESKTESDNINQREYIISNFLDNIKHSFCEKTPNIQDIRHKQDMIYADISSLKNIKCSDNEIRFEFSLEDEGSLSIILTSLKDQLILKHDLRDKDHAPAEITMFGGFAETSENSNKIIFPSHRFGTQRMWPGYENTSWELEWKEEQKKLTYKEFKNGEEMLMLSVY